MYFLDNAGNGLVRGVKSLFRKVRCHFIPRIQLGFKTNKMTKITCPKCDGKKVIQNVSMAG